MMLERLRWSEARLSALVIATLLSLFFFAQTAGAQSVVATVNVGSAPWGVAYDSAKGEVFVANEGNSTVSVIDDSTNAVVASVNVGSDPFGVAYDFGKGEVFVAN
jgi:YVTN family beta-propeller protein